MTPERFRQVEALYQRVLDLPASDRMALLDQADSESRREVESLLMQHGSLLDRPAWEDRTGAILTDRSGRTTAGDLPADKRLGPYKIEQLIGSGGMGQVFRAVDTRLGRLVAIKTSRQTFEARFQREARNIAQLNHPNICTLHDIGPNYLVMELLTGETLADRLRKGPLPMNEVFRYGAQIADAMAAAHSQGIVHRDMKPANVMIAKGIAKVLDFGIARSVQDESLTGAMLAIGTPAYMAPEQREGKKCDARSDIYALGLILREMATGDRNGDLARTPANFAHIVTRCLECDPADRWQTASDVRRELEWAAVMKPNPGSALAPPAKGLRAVKPAWAVAAIACLGLLIALTAIYRQHSTRDVGQSEFILTLAQNNDVTPAGLPVPSPDGRLIAFEGKNPQGVNSIWIRPLNAVDIRQLPGTEGVEGAVVWSPDGSRLAFYAEGKLKKIGIGGGPPEITATIPGFQDAAWGPRGDIIFRPDNRTALFRIRETGGSAQALTKLNQALLENSHRFPEFLPDGRHFFFVSRCAELANDALYLASLDGPELKKIMPAQSRISYIPGAILFYRGGALMAQRFNPDRAELSGDAIPVMTGMSYSAPSIAAGFRASRGGELILAEAADASDTNIVWYGRNGEQMGQLGGRGQYAQPRISPDGSRVVFESPDPQTGNRDLWYIELPRGITSRLTTNVANDWFPVWSPDGRQIAFDSDRDTGQILQPFLKTSMDPGSSESRVSSRRFGPKADGIFDWSRDGNWMAFGSSDIEILPVSRPDARFSFLASPAVETSPRFSPDSKWIAYTSDESGRNEIYVRPFDGAPAGSTGKVRISENGGEYPVWSRSGEELYYMSADNTIHASDTRGLGRAAAMGRSVALFKACPGTASVGPPLSKVPYLYPFDTQDGKRFLVICRAEPAGRFTVLLNWRFPQ